MILGTWTRMFLATTLLSVTACKEKAPSATSVATSPAPVPGSGDPAAAPSSTVTPAPTGRPVEAPPRSPNEPLPAERGPRVILGGDPSKPVNIDAPTAKGAAMLYVRVMPWGEKVKAALDKEIELAPGKTETLRLELRGKPHELVLRATESPSGATLAEYELRTGPGPTELVHKGIFPFSARPGGQCAIEDQQRYGFRIVKAAGVGASARMRCEGLMRAVGLMR